MDKNFALWCFLEKTKSWNKNLEKKSREKIPEERQNSEKKIPKRQNPEKSKIPKIKYQTCLLEK